MSGSDQPERPDPSQESATEDSTVPPSGPAPEPLTPLSVPPSGDATDTWKPRPPRASARFSAPLPGHTLLERYMVLGQLGEGGMGVVLSVYDGRLDRRVALKLLRPREALDGSSYDEQGRFLREAQAMARLNHPHVVAVYDAGRLEDGSLFIAMEHVEGQTLRRWQKQRPWREVLDKYLAAGRGLAAAHAAGLIHRDFKPDNVLVGQDGRARVTDFGLARIESPVALTEGEEAAPPTGALPSGALESPLTAPGQWMGTPRYMAPEQLRGQRSDGRSDLYSFCVSLYEALYGQRPFEGNNLAALQRAQRAGKAAPPADSEVPTWVGRTLLQGLHFDPDLRPASMTDLLTALEDDPAVKRRAWLRRAAVALVTTGLAVLAIWGWARQQIYGCERMGLRLAEVWDGAVKAQVEKALLDTGLPYAQATAERVTAALDGYAGAWVMQRTELCLSTWQEGSTQARGLAVLQESCLERRRSQLRALTELLSRTPDPALVGRAVQAVQALPPLEYCADARALTAAVPPPEDPAVRAKVEAVQEQVDRLEALFDAGQYKEGLARADTLLPQVEQAGHAPLLARTLFVAARLREATGDYPGAEARMRQALASAAQGRDMALLARAWSTLIMLVGYRQGRHEEALLLRPAVEHFAEVAGDDRIRAIALSGFGSVLMELGRYEEARQAYARVLALREKVVGPEHLDIATSLNNLGLALFYLGQYEDALELQARALAVREKLLGPEHPQMGNSLTNLGLVLWKLGRLEEAREAHARSLALKEKVLGPEHMEVASSLNNLALVLGELGRYEEALAAHQRVLALWEKTLGPEHADVGISLNNLGDTYEALGRYEEARRMHERALALRRKALGPEHPEVANSLSNLATALRELKRYAEAREHYARALALQDKVLPPEHPDRAWPLVGLSRLLLAQGRPAEALPLLERALRMIPENQRAQGQFALAEALWESGRDRPRALEQASQAREYWKRLGRKADVEQISRWMEERATATSPQDTSGPHPPARPKKKGSRR
ncbi:MAG: tetratricopeptide repeat protein [Myxococcaceae bacterium]|nr:tetratricopeptide repeat protein [Myxococcaceae bacterium]